MSVSNKGPGVDYRLQNLTNALYLDGNNDVVMRTGFAGNIVISGNVNVPGNVSVYSTPNNPVHVHVTELPPVTGNVGVSGNVSITQLPALGNVSITQMPAISGNVNVNNFPSNVSITSMPAITGNVMATLTNANVTVVALPSEQNAYTPNCFGNVSNPWTANVTSRPMFAITSTNPATRWFVKSYTFAVPTNVKNNVTPDVMRYIWIKNPTITGNVVYGLHSNNIQVAEFKDAGSLHQNLNANIAIDQNSGTILHMDLYFGNNTEVGDELATDWSFTDGDILVCCQRQLTTNVGSTTDVWWTLQVFEQ